MKISSKERRKEIDGRSYSVDKTTTVAIHMHIWQWKLAAVLSAMSQTVAVALTLPLIEN